jgi:hypothetical protein
MPERPRKASSLNDTNPFEEIKKGALMVTIQLFFRQR